MTAQAIVSRHPVRPGALRDVGLGGYADAFPGMLSGGQRQLAGYGCSRKTCGSREYDAT